jgi:glycosyltransferase involved in cell wall biosynthesis
VKIALFSPLNPVRSGIADYNEELLPELGRHAVIDLYIDGGYTPADRALGERWPVRVFNAATFRPDAYDAILYHMGNNFVAHRYIYEAMKLFPGVVVLHDYVLQGFYAEMLWAHRDRARYLELLQRFYPLDGSRLAQRMFDRVPPPIWESELALEFPLNEEIIGMARAVIVHSHFLKKRILDRHSLPVAVIPHHGHRPAPYARAQARAELGFRDQDLIVLSTGFVTRNKRYESIIPALDKLAMSRLRYVIIGQDEANYLKVICRDRALPIVRRGFVGHDELEKHLAAADICINLRHPTMGENSGSLLRMMSNAKAVLVSDTGSYRDLPDAAVIKVSCDVDEEEMIKRFVLALAEDADFRLSLGREAARYALEECSLAGCARRYAEFIGAQAAPDRRG